MSLGLTIAGQHLGSTPQSVPEGLIVIHAGNCPVMMLARDIEVMSAVDWHLIVLDEAQAIKNPDTQSTRAVCRLKARHRL